MTVPTENRRGAGPAALRSPPLRLLMLAEPYAPAVGGLERHVQELSRELVRRGHAVTVATTTHADAPSFELDEGVRVHRIAGLSRALAPFYRTDRRFHPTLPDPGVMVSLRRLLGHERPHIVHAHSWMLYSFLPLKTMRGPKLIVTLHDYSLICPKKTYLHKGRLCEGPAYAKCVRCAAAQYGPARSLALTTGLHLSRRMHDRVDRYVAVSRAVREPVVALERPAKPVAVVPGFIADEAAERAVRSPRPAFLPSGDDFLLFVGALGRHKGLDVLLEAWSGLRPRPPLVLIGTRREDTPMLPEDVTVVYDAPHEEVMAAWTRCLVGVVPSRSEGGGPLALVEAMACGRPVVASAVGGAPDIVVDGETGLLVPPGDAAALRTALQQLLADPERRRRMGRAARVRAQSFTLSAAADRLERIYAETLAGDAAADGVTPDGPSEGAGAAGGGR